MTQPAAFPQRVTFYGLMAIEAARKSSRVGGGWRVYVLAKSLDTTGLGNVKRDDLRAFVLSQGVHVRTWQRWITEARAASLVTDWQTACGDWMLALPSAGKAGFMLGCESIGRKVSMQTADLIGNGWKARVYSAWESGKQISREAIQKAVNIPVSTQRYRDVQAGIKRQRNYSKSNLKADSFAGVIEHTDHKVPFVTRDGFIAWRLPDTRTASHAQTLGRGRARKAVA